MNAKTYLNRLCTTIFI